MNGSTEMGGVENEFLDGERVRVAREALLVILAESGRFVLREQLQRLRDQPVEAEQTAEDQTLVEVLRVRRVAQLPLARVLKAK